MAQRNEFDKTIAETEAAYMKVTALDYRTNGDRNNVGRSQCGKSRAQRRQPYTDVYLIRLFQHILRWV